MAGLMAILFVLLGLPVAATLPPHLWFRFQTASAQPVTLKGVQFAVCRTETCDRAILLMQSGTCDQAGCIKTAPALKPPHRFDCAESTCLYAESRNPPSGTRFKLIAQIQNRVLSSAPFTSDFRSAVGQRDRTVRVAEQLTVTRDHQPRPTRWETFWRGLLLTEVSEWTVAAIAWRYLPRPIFRQTLALIGLTNLLTFPVVWFFLPALQPFQYGSTRVFGAVSVAIALVFSSYLVTRSRLTPKILVRTGTLWLLALPVGLAMGFGLSSALTEGLPSAAGLPRLGTDLAAAGFAIAWETWVLRAATRGVMTIAQTVWLSGLMNLVSLGLCGWLLGR
jgi:hypothetical protein